MIRLFEFKNSFMRKQARAVSARFSSIGYFDGLDMAVFSEEETILSEPIRLDHLEKEECDFFSMTGMREQEDEAFWENSTEPYLFVSYLRLEDASENLDGIVEAIEGKFNAVCYYTIDSSDLIICMKSRAYKDAYINIERGYPEVVAGKEKKGNKIKKIYSIVSLEQSFLDNIEAYADRIVNEKISCYLGCVVKDWDEIDAFIGELKRELPGGKIKRFGVLGSDDVIIEINDIEILRLLALFGQRRLLVHDNEFYSRAFYNIKTEILVDSGE